jgi:hypothetical protein
LINEIFMKKFYYFEKCRRKKNGNFLYIVAMFFFISVFYPGKIRAGSFADINNKKIIQSADIIRTSYENTPVINLYQGNGSFGSSYGAFGLHNHPADESLSKQGKTRYMHLKHWTRVVLGQDYLLPIGNLYWKDTPAETDSYRQQQSFYDGTILTRFVSRSTDVTVKTWFDPVAADLGVITIDVKGDNVSDILFAPTRNMGVHYNLELVQSAEIIPFRDFWKIELSCLNRKTSVYVKSNAEVQIQDSVLVFKLHEGKNEILISVDNPIMPSSEKSLKQTTKWWQSKWENSGLVVIPDSNAQKMWVRSMAQFLFSYNDRKLGLTPPNGLSGNVWPFGFPQDISYIHPLFLASGNIDIAGSIVEYFAEHLDGMKAYTKRLLNVEGVHTPWTFPYGDFEGCHSPKTPNRNYYQIHNSGYLARMAYETAVFINDEKWTVQYARPLIEETAKFYKNICIKGADGLWHISARPSMGQDEHGGENKDDYLCSLFSAEYCFQKAVEYGLDVDGMYAAILKDGLAFNALLSEKDVYLACRGNDQSGFGKQKHPVQLNDLAYLPVGGSVDRHSARAYNLRYDVTQSAQRSYFFGWTLGEFLLAGSRIGNADEWLKDWNQLLRADYVDSDWIQVYETSQMHDRSFYTITNGLIAQSLLNNVVSDWFGKLEIAKCNPWKGKVYVKNIYSKLGVKIDGEIDGTTASLRLTAWKDCNFELNGEWITLRKGQKINQFLSAN